MLFKVPLCLGHVGELHYVSLIPSSDSSNVIHEYSKELDPSTLNVPAPVLSDTCSSVMLNDIGYAVENRCRLTAAEKLHFLQNPWTPAGDFKWPFTERMDHGKIRKKYLGKQHITGVNHVFTYSTAKAGLFCTVCVLFASDTAGGVNLDRLVKSPLQKYAHLTGRDCYLTNHLETSSHQDCVQKAAAFKAQMLSSSGDILHQMDTEFDHQRRENRSALMRIIRAIEFHGRLGLPLRGHDDSGTLSIPERDQLQQLSHLDYSEGNLRALLQLMIDCDDEILRKHFRTAPKHATYISPLSQNQIIDAISNVMQRKIVSEVQNAQFFTLLADETTDFSKQEQLSVCLRYVTKTFTIKERFLGFAIAPDLTGKGLAKQLIRILVDAGIDKAYIKKYMVGQGYDGASAMS